MPFYDLSDNEIQPVFDVRSTTFNFSISDQLKNGIKQTLEAGGNATVDFYDSYAVAQTGRDNYIFFPYQWFYLAAICRRYSEYLREYCDFYDEHIKGNREIEVLLRNQKYNSEPMRRLIQDDVERHRFGLFIAGGRNRDTAFRVGKIAIDSNGGRGGDDVFASGILGKLPVSQSSCSYLGEIIYSLAGNLELYNELVNEIQQQFNTNDGKIRLSSNYCDCAKEIVDKIYEIDGFERLSEIIAVLKKNIKIETKNLVDILPSGNWLRYMFARPSSSMYDLEERVFSKIYTMNIDGEFLEFKLTTEWVGIPVTEGQNGNYLQALISIVNHYYSDYLTIYEENGSYYLIQANVSFKMSDLPKMFDADFVTRYITSLLAKPFVILTGNSGTGKTRIAKQFAGYLAVKDESGEMNSVIVPIGADWTDNTNVLGFYNPLADNGAGKYEKTQILELIERANRHRDIPYFLILDEMNLSHVERYFADFLSHMETKESFKLKGYKYIDENGKEINELPYPENLFVIGTVNVDETTYMFSPKVLDRANVIEFKPDDTKVLSLYFSSVSENKVESAGEQVARAFLELATGIRNDKGNLDSTTMQRIHDVFLDIYVELKKRGYEFGYRTVKEIKTYLIAASKLGNGEDGFNLAKGIDEQLLQKVLPKIHGNRKEISDMLDELKKICARENLNLSADKIDKMIDKLNTVQYASFI